MELQSVILQNLIHNESFTRQAIPHLEARFFEGDHKIMFDNIVGFVNKYGKLPNKDALIVELQGGSHDPSIFSLAEEVSRESDVDNDWLIDKTEKWCQDRSIFLAIMESISILDGNHSDLTPNALPDLLQKALSVTFDPSVGHDYIDDSDSRYDFYHTEEERVPFDLDYFNRITKGGLPKKTLNICLAGTGAGKSLFMCHCASANISAGSNVLYITMEMSEERIAERIDANLMNVDIGELDKLNKAQFDSKIEKISKKGIGKLVVKEYPTGAASASHFRALLNELKTKKNFVPDMIYIDYLNICASSRMKAGGSVNSYTYVKAIAEELRGLAVEHNVPVMSATQTTRGGYGNSDVGLEDTSESFGLPATADLMFALISTEEMENLNQVTIKQLKNRYNDPSAYKKFVVGIDRPKMRLYDVEEAAQNLNIEGVGNEWKIE